MNILETIAKGLIENDAAFAAWKKPFEAPGADIALERKRSWSSIKWKLRREREAGFLVVFFQSFFPTTSCHGFRKIFSSLRGLSQRNPEPTSTANLGNIGLTAKTLYDNHREADARGARPWGGVERG